MLGSLRDEDKHCISAWLEGVHSTLGELFACLCALIYERDIPGRGRLIAHCVRELRNGLVFHLVAKETKLLLYSKEVDEIARDWDRLGPIIEEASYTPSQSTILISVDSRLVSRVIRLIEEHKSTSDKQLDKAVRLFSTFQLAEGDSTSIRVLAKNWKELTDWFVGVVHERERTDTILLNAEFNEKVADFEATLLRFATAGAFFDGLEELDEILAAANR